MSDLKQKGRTILLTTHYMDEAEKLCDRVAIMDHGKVIAEGSPGQLIARQGGEHVIQFSLQAQDGHRPTSDEFARIEGATRVDEESDGYVLTVKETHRSLPHLLKHLEAQQLKLESLATRHANLEDVFVNLTGRHLRDE